MIDCTLVFFGKHKRNFSDEEIKNAYELLHNRFSESDANKNLLQKVLLLSYKILTAPELKEKFFAIPQAKLDRIYHICPYCKEKNVPKAEYCVNCGWEMSQGYLVDVSEEKVKELENFIKEIKKELETPKEPEPISKGTEHTPSPVKNASETFEIEQRNSKPSEKVHTNIPKTKEKEQSRIAEDSSEKTVVVSSSFEEKSDFVACLKEIETFREKIIKKDVFIIGRKSDCDFVINRNVVGPNIYNQISRHHCEIIKINGLYFLKDTSRNGVSIDGKELKRGGTHPLKGGEIIGYKGYKLIFYFKQIPQKRG